eukprot:6325515-Amphidinium_carterae.2
MDSIARGWKCNMCSAEQTSSNGQASGSMFISSQYPPPWKLGCVHEQQLSGHCPGAIGLDSATV